MREILSTDEYKEFYNSLNTKIQDKIKYGIQVIEEIPVVSTKLIKKLVNTDLYEMRISVDNEYRIILFCIDHDNFINAKQIIFLNGFVKKSTKDYEKQIKKAETILKGLEL